MKRISYIIITLLLLIILTSASSITISSFSSNTSFLNTYINTTGYIEINETSNNYTHRWNADSSTEDSVPVPLNLTINANVTYVQGKYGSAFKFYGLLSNVTTSTPISSASSASYMAWISPSGYTYTEYQTIMGSTDSLGNDENYVYNIDAKNIDCPSGDWGSIIGNGVTFQVACSGQLYNSSNFPTNAWTHVAVTYNGSYITFYKNGSLITSLPQTVSGQYTSNNIYAIGSLGGYVNYGNKPRYFFNGSIDEPRIYDYQLSQSEIQSIINHSRYPTGNVTIHYDLGYSFNGSTISANFTSPSGTNITYSDNTSTIQTNATSSFTYSINNKSQIQYITFTLLSNDSLTPSLINYTLNSEIDHIPTTPEVSYPANASRHYNNSINYTWNTSTDSFPDAISYHYQYTTDLSFLTFTSANTSLNYTTPIFTTDGTTYFMRVRSFDQYHYSDWSQIINYTENTAPVLSNVTISPSSPLISDNLTAFYTATDAQSDTLTNNISWYKNSILNTSIGNNTVVNSSNLTAGDSWYFIATSSDSYETTSVQSSSIIINSSNSPPTFQYLNITPSYGIKYNKTFTINASQITDDSTSWRLETYYLNGTNRTYLYNSSYVSTSNIESSVIYNPFSDGLTHEIYGYIYDSGNATGQQNLSSSEHIASLISSVSALTLNSSSVSSSSISTGASITISSQINGTGANISSVLVRVTRPDATVANWSMSCNDSPLSNCTYAYLFTSDQGTYTINYFYATDDSGISTTLTPSPSLTFIASTPTTVITSPSGGGSGTQTTIIKLIDNATNKTLSILPTIELRNITSISTSEQLKSMGDCLSSDILLSTTCTTSSKLIITDISNIWVYISAYISSIITIFLMTLIDRKRRNLFIDTISYGTITILFLLVFSLIGFNLYFANYILNNASSGIISLSIGIWSFLITIIGDRYFK